MENVVQGEWKQDVFFFCVCLFVGFYIVYIYDKFEINQQGGNEGERGRKGRDEGVEREREEEGGRSNECVCVVKMRGNYIWMTILQMHLPPLPYFSISMIFLDVVIQCVH